MNFVASLYNKMALRKGKPADMEPYAGGNGRVDRAVEVILNDGFPTSGKLIDVGGSIGNLGYALRDHFSERIVVDVCDLDRPAAEAKGNVFHHMNVDQNGLPCQQGTVDLIVALDLIEHIMDPQRFANECFNKLRSGGMVLINTPNIQYWKHLESLVCNGIFPHTSGDAEVYHGGHVAFFNANDMRQIFSSFSDHRVHTRGLPCNPSPPIWLNLFSGPDKTTQLSYADLVFSCKKP